MITLKEMEDYFIANPVKKGPWKIDACSTCTNPAKMVKSHIATLKNYPGNMTFKPYWDRLLKLYKHNYEHTTK